MSNYHTQSLADADIFTIMGSVYAEVARYDSALTSDRLDQADQAAKRAQEIVDYAKELEQIKPAQKLELTQFNNLFMDRVNESKISGLDNYLMPFAMTERMHR
ncbi:MAG: Na+/phosphate symporter [Candidatus Saccharimonadales bacterium]|jgi:Na+/phosphate symporter